MTDEAIVKATCSWVEKMVIDLNLCPFAKRELVKNRIRFVVSSAVNDEELLEDLQYELTHLQQHNEVETTLLIHPDCHRDFLVFNEFLDLADQLVLELDMEGLFQVASFHPEYQFADTDYDDVENFTNRSPYPTLHLIREESLTRVIDDYPNIDSIPENNIQLMRKMGREQLEALFRTCLAQ